MSELKRIFDDIVNAEQFLKDETLKKYLDYPLPATYKLLVWLGNHLNKNTKHSYATGASTIFTYLNVEERNGRKALKQLVDAGCLHRCGNIGDRGGRNWSLGSKEDCEYCKLTVKYTLVKSELKDGFAEVNKLAFELYDLYKSNKHDELFTQVMRGVGNPESIEQLGFVEKYRTILDAFGIGSNSLHNDWFECQKRLKKHGIEEDNNSFGKKIKAKSIINYACKYIMPKVKNDRILSNERYPTNLIDVFIKQKQTTKEDVDE